MASKRGSLYIFELFWVLPKVISPVDYSLSACGGVEKKYSKAKKKNNQET